MRTHCLVAIETHCLVVIETHSLVAMEAHDKVNRDTNFWLLLKHTACLLWKQIL